MMPLGPPFHFRRHFELIGIESGDGRAIAYIYFEDEPSRRQRIRRDHSTAISKSRSTRGGPFGLLA